MGKKKLCRSKELADDKHREELFDIIRKPKFFCKKCIRVACSEEFLCKPEKLKRRDE